MFGLHPAGMVLTGCEARPVSAVQQLRPHEAGRPVCTFSRGSPVLRATWEGHQPSEEQVARAGSSAHAGPSGRHLPRTAHYGCGAPSLQVKASLAFGRFLSPCCPFLMSAGRLGCLA